jgi:hypothetical protein
VIDTKGSLHGDKNSGIMKSTTRPVSKAQGNNAWRFISVSIEHIRLVVLCTEIASVTV